MLRSILVLLLAACSLLTAATAGAELLTEIELFGDGSRVPTMLQLKAASSPVDWALGIAGAQFNSGEVGVEKISAADWSTGTIGLEYWLVNETLTPLHPWDTHILFVADWGLLYYLNPTELTTSFTDSRLRVTSYIPEHPLSLHGYDITAFGFMTTPTGSGVFRIYGSAIAPEPSSIALLLMLLPFVLLRVR